jgi:aspartate aminotransferase-like enzyme
VTAALVPSEMDWKSFNADLRRRGLVLAGGQGKLTGLVFRVGHLGDVTVNQILAALEILEEALVAARRPVERGAALVAAVRAADAALAAGAAAVGAAATVPAGKGAAA